MNAKRALEAVASRLVPERRLPRVLYYHSVHPDAPLAHRPGAFEDQLRLLADQGYQVLTFADAAARLGDLPDRTAVVTFDDGYADNCTHALPILARRGVTATVFVVSSMIGRSSDEGHKLYGGRPMLTRDQIRELAAADVEIASHTRSHVHLQRTFEADPAEADRELRGSREDLEDVVGAPIVSFAYPNGQRGVFSPDTRRAIAHAGYRYACTTMWGALTVGADPLELPRIEIRADDDLRVFARKLAGRYDFMGPYCRMTRRSDRW